LQNLEGRGDEAGGGVEAAVEQHAQQHALGGIVDPGVEERHEGDAHQDKPARIWQQ
jgi:hypothetical protein